MNPKLYSIIGVVVIISSLIGLYMYKNHGMSLGQQQQQGQVVQQGQQGQPVQGEVQRDPYSDYSAPAKN